MGLKGVAWPDDENLFNLVTLKDPIERGLKVQLFVYASTDEIIVTLKDPIERGLKGR